ncbi:MAG: terminase small subunit [Xanthomonadales bacterium]|nr:terminase small subunit [Xanthomonadales bacterium]
MRTLTAKEQRFVDEYLIDLDPQRAAIAAGYRESTARIKSYGWVSKPDDKPHIYQAVQAAKEARSEKLKLDADEVLRHALQLSVYDVRELFDDSGELVPPHELPANLARVVQGIHRRADGSYEYRLPDRNAATERLIKHLGLYERDNLQTRNDSLLDVMQKIAAGKNALDLARERS